MGYQAGVRVRRDEAHAVETTRHQTAQKRQPCGSVFGGEDVHAEYFALAHGVDTDCNHGRNVDNAATFAALVDQGVDPLVGGTCERLAGDCGSPR